MKNNLIVKLLILSVLLLPVLCQSCSDNRTGTDSRLMVGAAIRNITPGDNMFPLWRMPNVEIEGVLDSIYLRVIAVSSGKTTSLIICSETGRGPYGPLYAKTVAEHTGLPLESVFLTTSHAHAAPEITKNIDLYFEEGSEITTQQLWGKYVMDQMLSAADEAISNLKPASVGIGRGESYINVNRSVKYNRVNEDGTVTEYTSYGFNPEGPSDKELIALRFNDEAGNPIAFIINYAVHGTVMHANTCSDGKTAVSGDIPGFVSGYLEDKYEGSVAIWLSGAAGDQAPLIQNQLFFRNPVTGEQEEKFTCNYDMLSYISKLHFADIESALSGINEFNDAVNVNYDFVRSAIPARDSSEYPLSLQLLRIGDIALLGFPGEMYTSIGMDLKQNSLLKNTIVFTHTWQRSFQQTGYHADDASLDAGVMASRRNYYRTGYIARELTSMMNAMIDETSEWRFNGDGTATNHRGKDIIVGLDGRPGTGDDNRIVSPAGKVLLTDVKLLYDDSRAPYVELGNGLNLYGGADNKIGTTDDIIKGFGRFIQNDTAGRDPELLNWRILDIVDGKAVIACESIITGLKFNLDSAAGNEWKDSNLRAWLNSEGGQDVTGDTTGFYNLAFNEAEKARIEKTDVSMQSDSGYIAYNALIRNRAVYITYGTDTQDYVYALSAEEVYKYFGVSDIATEEETKWKPINFTGAYYKPSFYALSHGVKINKGHNGPSFVGYGDFWTRSPGAKSTDGNSYGVFLGSMGSLNNGRPVTRVYGVVPVIKVSL